MTHGPRILDLGPVAVLARIQRGFAYLWLFCTRRQALTLLARQTCALRCLTFELTWRQRRDAKPAPQTMHTCTVARALWHAVGSQVERGVRRHWALALAMNASASMLGAWPGSVATWLNKVAYPKLAPLSS